MSPRAAMDVSDIDRELKERMAEPLVELVEAGECIDEHAGFGLEGEVDVRLLGVVSRVLMPSTSRAIPASSPMESGARPDQRETHSASRDLARSTARQRKSRRTARCGRSGSMRVGSCFFRGLSR